MKKLTLASDEKAQPGELVVVQNEAMAIRVSDTITIVVQHSSDYATVQLFESVDPNRKDDQAKKPPPSLSDEERKRLDDARRAGRARRMVGMVEIDSGVLSADLFGAIGGELGQSGDVAQQYTFSVVDAIGDVDLLAVDEPQGGMD